MVGVTTALLMSGCAVYGGTTPPPGVYIAAPTVTTSASTAQPTPTASGTPSPTPTPTPTPTPLPANVAASPGATTLAVLPDTRAGANLATPLIVRGIPYINHHHAISRALVPKVSKTYQLAPDVDAAYRRMIADAKQAGLTIVWRVGYRSWDAQATLLAHPPAEYADDPDGFIAKPGHSEHQAGLAVDIGSPRGLGNKFPKTKEFTWVRANSYKYGFILRYPPGKTAITEVNYEPWHYRYIGVDAAAAFGPNSTLTLEEYLGGR